jgi:hypothetical protein
METELAFLRIINVQGGSNMTGIFVCKQVTVFPGHI